MTAPAEALEVLAHWYSEAGRPLWFNATPQQDAALRDAYQLLWERAAGGGCDAWANSLPGARALVIVLDQFPLNMFRGTPRAFHGEAKAREMARRALAMPGIDALTADERLFLHLPFTHSEHLPDQDESVRLFEQAGMTEGLKWAWHHRNIVHRFGRFPHRNAILGRPSTAEEQAWLASPEAFHG
jgi:uncharacterized protein (DUF924 family)